MIVLIAQGISNVAFLSIGLGISNTVSDAFIEAKVQTEFITCHHWLSQ